MASLRLLVSVCSWFFRNSLATLSPMCDLQAPVSRRAWSGLSKIRAVHAVGYPYLVSRLGMCGSGKVSRLSGACLVSLYATREVPAMTPDLPHLEQNRTGEGGFGTSISCMPVVPTSPTLQKWFRWWW
ncbi:hypothetical protein WA026_011284 [Henosepilachna vigintioctopunctata]|uniref:Secreted protein n=1 Tax=Henosepilachna vigintioctopunctata TaxID=420089 RepID=A0AAW1U659_9CUCU